MNLFDLLLEHDQMAHTFGGSNTRPTSLTKLGSMVIPEERSIGSSSYLLLLKACKKI